MTVPAGERLGLGHVEAGLVDRPDAAHIENHKPPAAWQGEIGAEF